MTAQLTKAPVTAGKAVIEFTPDSGPRPICVEDTITFPFRFDQAVMHSLQGGEQFLLRQADRPQVYFGGTDEQPFLVELDSAHLDSFEQGGEEAFYDGLKPVAIKRLETMFGGDEATVRQGDIWAYRLPIEWDELLEIYLRSTGGRAIKTARGTMNVFGTRHVLSGRWFKGRPRVPFEGKLFSILDKVAEGALTAADHADRVLAGPHVMARTEGIVPQPGRWVAGQLLFDTERHGPLAKQVQR